jgi:hypothetical protein
MPVDLLLAAHSKAGTRTYAGLVAAHLSALL